MIKFPLRPGRRPGSRWVVLPTLALSAVLLAVLAGTSAPASAQARSPAATPPPLIFVGTFFLKNHSTGLCADDSNLGLRAIACNNLNFQEWKIWALNTTKTIVQIQNVETSRCIVQLAPPAPLKTAACNRAVQGQQWSSSTWSVSGHLFAWFEQFSGRGCLDDSSEGFRTAACGSPITSDPHQVWQLD
jgi:hypothetical protein